MTRIDEAQHRLGWHGLATPPPRTHQLPRALADVLAVPSATTSHGTCYDLGAVVLAGATGVPEPCLDEGVSELAPSLHHSLVEVYRIHNGIGPAGTPKSPFGSPRLLPLTVVAPLTHWMRFGENDIEYAPGDWLRFTADPLGGWCMSATGTVRHWNAHTHELGPRSHADAPWRALAHAWTLWTQA